MVEDQVVCLNNLNWNENRIARTVCDDRTEEQGVVRSFELTVANENDNGVHIEDAAHDAKHQRHRGPCLDIQRVKKCE